MKVALIIDDSIEDFELATYHLTKHIEDISFTHAISMKDYLEKIQWIKPDIIICDYNLGDAYGIDILLDVKSKGVSCPFVFFTGMLNDEYKATKAVLQGASGYVLKDDIKKLPTVVSDLLQSAADQNIKENSIIELVQSLKLKTEKAQSLVNEQGMKELIASIRNDLLSLAKKIT